MCSDSSDDTLRMYHGINPHETLISSTFKV